MLSRTVMLIVVSEKVSKTARVSENVVRFEIPSNLCSVQN